MPIKLKRVYEAPAAGDGFRVLVDRLWPRGMTKAEAAVDLWVRELAPSNELRKQFHAQPEAWEEFASAYAAELRDKTKDLQSLRARGRQATVTLLYAASDPVHNNAAALKRILESGK